MTNSVFSIYNCLQVQKIASSGGEQGSLVLVEAMEATISKILETGEVIPLRSSHQQSGGEGLHLDGFLVQQKKAHLAKRGGVQVHAAYPQG